MDNTEKDKQIAELLDAAHFVREITKLDWEINRQVTKNHVLSVVLPSIQEISFSLAPKTNIPATLSYLSELSPVLYNGTG